MRLGIFFSCKMSSGSNTHEARVLLLRTFWRKRSGYVGFAAICFGWLKMKVLNLQPHFVSCFLKVSGVGIQTIWSGIYWPLRIPDLVWSMIPLLSSPGWT